MHLLLGQKWEKGLLEKCSQEVSSAEIEEKDIISVLPSTLSFKVSVVVGL